MKTAQSTRPYLYEFDRMRIITALSVVTVHVIALTTFLDATVSTLQVQNAFVTIFHFTRAVFMFVTAFALVHVYYGKPFSWGRFWKRRGIGVVLPYTIWSIIYVLVNPHPNSPPLLMRRILGDLLTGHASYQLYYILLTIQFYLLFPLFLKFLQRVMRHPWIVLGLSFMFEVVTFYAIQNNLQSYLPGFIELFLNRFKDSLVFVYQFYFILGGLAALYLQSVRAFLRRHGAWVIGSMAAALAALQLNYVDALFVEHASLSSAVAVLQPVMAFYSTAVIFFLYWLTYRQVARITHPESARGQRIWHTLSDASFGVYLVHPLLLSAVTGLIMAYFMSWPTILLVVLIWLLTAGGAVACTVLLLNVPMLSRLVGHARPMPRIPFILAWKGELWSALRMGKQMPIQRLGQDEEQAQFSSSPRSEHATDDMAHRLETVEGGRASL